TQDVCCVAFELSQSKWLCAFAPPEGAKLTLHKGRRSRTPGGMARSAAGPCGRSARPPARTRYLLRSRLRRFLAGPPPAEGRRPNGGVRPGELPEAAPWSVGQDRSARRGRNDAHPAILARRRQLGRARGADS